jgi:outer membrane lipopolysaccharide assembly protein LptE/RlpB
MKAIRHFRLLLIAAWLVPVISGCGYTLQGRATLPFQGVKIGKIVNKTYELKLEDRMQRLLTEELLKNGFVLETDAAYSIECVLNIFTLRVLSVKDNVASEYEVVIKGDYRLLEPSGKTRTLKGDGIFRISFTSTEALQNVEVRKEIATERALRDISSEIVASIIYQ